MIWETKCIFTMSDMELWTPVLCTFTFSSPKQIWTSNKFYSQQVLSYTGVRVVWWFLFLSFLWEACGVKPTYVEKWLGDVCMLCREATGVSIRGTLLIWAPKLWMIFISVEALFWAPHEVAMTLLRLLTPLKTVVSIRWEAASSWHNNSIQ
jgi:hypothetical protein